MHLNKFSIYVFLLSFAVTSSFAQEKYEIDVSHSNIIFTVRHMVIAKVSGKFTEFSGTILYDEKDLKKSSVDVRIKSASIDTENERRDTHLKSADFFDVGNHPEITFVSREIRKQNGGFVAVGDLTMRGITRQIELPFTILGIIKDSWGNTRLGIEAGITLNRFDYDVKWDKKLDDGNLIVSKDVEVKLNIEAIASRKQ
ncbi:MAG: YceI family protein [candidate division KSB1 bacterium]|nr:YceI family protein [candidate division KSB1 bacterium]MDZ7304365.1 YceI family protein [candidate division KSB1 bacterium]MDZ7313514.1 YceI family protein [candidate division KSB1 bacterium]